MNQIQLDCFMSAALNGSLSTAAKSLFLSTQVVSQHIQKLEAELGAALFTRTKTGVTLTEYGQDFFNLASEWSVLYKDTLRSIEEAYSEMSASLKIGISEYIDYMGEISGPLLSFSDSHDNFNIMGNHYKSSVLLKSIDCGEIDIAIIPNTQIVSNGDYNVAPFAKEYLHLFISGEINNKKKLVLGSAELDEVCLSRPQLTTSYGVWTDEEWREVSTRMSSSQNYKQGKTIELPNFRSVIVSLHYMPAIAVCDVRFGYPVDDSIFHLPLSFDSCLCCVWHKQNENSLAKEFADHMIHYYNEDL